MNQKTMPAGPLRRSFSEASRQGFLPIIFVIIVGAVVVMAGGFFFYYHQSARQSTSVPGMQATSEAPPAASQNTSVPGTQPSPESSSGKIPSASNEQTNQKAVPKTPAQAQNSVSSGQAPAQPSSAVACANPYADTAHMDIFDAHTHIISSMNASEVISEMDKAGVSTANLYPIDGDDDSSSLAAISQYPGRFITFVDTPDSPQPSTWLAQGQAFITHAEAQLSTGKFYGIGETNLRYYNGSGYTPPPDIYVSPDNSFWNQVVNLSAQHHIPVSFHFVPDDSAANAVLEKMLSSHADATFIWAHLGFNNMPLDSTVLSDYLLRYPNLYFDTAGIQNMQNPLPQQNSNWARLTDQSLNGQLNETWRQFFETWNARILFGSDAGGGPNGQERWQNYADNVVQGATPNAIGHWRTLFSNLDQNAARNIFGANAQELFLKKQKRSYAYSVSSGGACYSISVRSTSSISALAFNSSTHAITFTAAGSTGSSGNATVTIPTALAAGNFIAFVDGKNAQSQATSNSSDTIISLQYAGGIRTITLSAQAAR